MMFHDAGFLQVPAQSIGKAVIPTHVEEFPDRFPDKKYRDVVWVANFMGIRHAESQDEGGKTLFHHLFQMS